MQLVLQPCSDPEARKHFVDTVENPVAVSKLLPYLSQAEHAIVASTFGQAVAVWGVTPAKDQSNANRWAKMEVGDTALFYRGRRFFFRSTVAFKIRSEPLATQLWSRRPDGSTWEHVFFLTDLEAVDISIEAFNRAAGYAANYVVQHYTVLPPEQSERVAQALDLVEASGARALSSSEIARAQERLRSLGRDLDAYSLGKRRIEQSLLRDLLLSGKEQQRCALCGRTVPVDLICVGHIKPRHSCTEDERKSLGNVMSVCLLGCDRLFENGYLCVDVAGAIQLTRLRRLSNDLLDAVRPLVGRKCSAWNVESEVFFQWHREHLRRFI